MASAAEQLAATLNFGVLAKATELKKRIWFTLGALIVYRLGTYIPIPGIDPQVLEEIFNAQRGGILGMPAVLAMTSMPNRTSAVKRGAWVLEQVLGEHIPPPPPDVAVLPAKETESGKTIRQLLKLHVEDKSLKQSELEALAKEAHEKICPYSHATRNNVPVELEIVGG